MNETILNLALSSLPRILLEDIFFQNLCNQISLDFKLYEKIELRDWIYQSLKKIEPLVDKYFCASKSKSELLKMMLFYPNNLLSFHITEENGNYITKVKLTDGEEITMIEFTKKLSESKIKIVKKKMNNGLITEYKSDIYYYDEFYHKIHKTESLNEILKDFSNLFYIPEELALVFYKNFDKYQVQLNREKILSEIELDNLTRPEREEYTFTEPIFLGILEESLMISSDLKETDIILELKKQIKEEVVVFSNPLFESLIKYYTGFNAGLISTKGIIIGKEGEHYNEYQVIIDNSKINMKRTIISKEKAQELFFRSDNNLASENLKEFFGISKMR